jgi:transcriptional regulator with XRE-family HTH domain
MLNLYERIDALCKSKKTTISAMCKDLSINRSTLSELSSGRTKSLSTANINKIADYFNVSIDYLLGNEQKNSGEPELNSAFFRLKKGLEPYDLDEEDAEFLLTVFKAHKEKNK